MGIEARFTVAPPRARSGERTSAPPGTKHRRIVDASGHLAPGTSGRSGLHDARRSAAKRRGDHAGNCAEPGDTARRPPPQVQVLVVEAAASPIAASRAASSNRVDRLGMVLAELPSDRRSPLGDSGVEVLESFGAGAHPYRSGGGIFQVKSAFDAQHGG